mmetsp:Transcript_2674/g.9605  ORF Transcript_2674/g.9605 Transcript_2674/m.9605 type:complete len:206 (+) Transcript_2674:316-933(+)
MIASMVSRLSFETSKSSSLVKLFAIEWLLQSGVAEIISTWSILYFFDQVCQFLMSSNIVGFCVGSMSTLMTSNMWERFSTSTRRLTGEVPEQSSSTTILLPRLPARLPDTKREEINSFEIPYFPPEFISTVNFRAERAERGLKLYPDVVVFEASAFGASVIVSEVASALALVGTSDISCTSSSTSPCTGLSAGSTVLFGKTSSSL